MRALTFEQCVRSLGIIPSVAIMIGKTISHYRIEEELGRGGMGVVYRARDERLRRAVAIKLLTEELVSHAERRERLLGEARAAAALNHPGIATIYEVGEEGELIFIVMEMVAGRTLREILAAGPMEPKALARLGGMVAEALEAAHTRGVVHGDVKPENIVVQADGGVKLLDFGVARHKAEENLTLTRSLEATAAAVPDSRIAGTLAYMSPEQLRGEELDGRSDVYSTGVVLYELTSGRRPFLGPTATALIAQILSEPAARLDGVNSIVPVELARIVQKLLEKKRELRYASARELRVDLANLARELEFGATLPAAVAGKRTVAVLPFKLLTPNPEDEYLGVALADAVINQLSASGELLVRPTSTVQRYAKQSVDPLVAARELNVQVVVDGSIQKFGPKLRVHVQAWNAAGGTSLFSAKHDAEIADLFVLQDEIAEGLARSFGVKESARPETKPEPPTRNAMAYELFLRAVERLSRVNRWDTRTAIEMLESATKLDPNFANAWARLADACVFMGGTFEPVPKWFEKAEKAIRRALALDSENAEAHCARGRVLWTPLKGFRNRDALRALNHSLDLSPGCHPALVWKCLILLHVGLLEEAKEGLLEALASHPDDGFTLTFLAQALMLQGHHEESEDFLARALTLDPANLWANLFAPMNLLYTKSPEGAAERIRSAQQIVPGDGFLTSWEALLWAKRGEFRKAETVVRRALKSGKTVLHTHHMLHTAAAVYATIGKPAPAVALLRKASATGLPNYPVFRDDPHFQTLRNNAQYVKLLGELRRDWEKYRREFSNSAR
ncbi:MAG: protein kinase domain-containing protein [Candidatus Acidiferrales bacterium]